MTCATSAEVCASLHPESAWASCYSCFATASFLCIVAPVLVLQLLPFSAKLLQFLFCNCFLSLLSCSSKRVGLPMVRKSSDMYLNSLNYYCTCIGFTRTVYMHRIWPYMWWFPCQKCRIYVVYIWSWPSAASAALFTIHNWTVCSLFLPGSSRLELLLDV